MRPFLITVLGVTAACLAAYALERLFNLGTLAALLIATFALLALYNSWKNEPLSSALLGTMPFLGWLFANPEWSRVTLVLYASFAFIAFACALRKRHPSMFAGSAAAAVVAAAKLFESLS